MHMPQFIAKPVFHLFYRYYRRASPMPPIRRVIKPYPLAAASAFEDLFASASASGCIDPIEYNLPFPKVDFLNYLCDWRGFVAHGSTLPDLATLQPLRLTKDTSEFGNRQQIFSSPDAIWALWFAILDKSRIRFTENGCVRVGHGPGRIKYYHFDLPAENKPDPPFTEGMVYIANAGDFPDHRPYPMLDWFDAEVEEWGSTVPVTPLVKLSVIPEDFPYLDKVQFRL